MLLTPSSFGVVRGEPSSAWHPTASQLHRTRCNNVQYGVMDEFSREWVNPYRAPVLFDATTDSGPLTQRP